MTSPQENGAAKWKSPIAGEGKREHKHMLDTEIKQTAAQKVQICLGNYISIAWVTKAVLVGLSYLWCTVQATSRQPWPF